MPSKARQPAAGIKASVATITDAPNRSANRGASRFNGKTIPIINQYGSQTCGEWGQALDLLEIQAEDEDQPVKRDVARRCRLSRPQPLNHDN